MAPPPSSHPTTPEAEFLRTVLTQIDQTWGDVEPVYDLFRKNLDKLTETLLDELPAVFSELVAGQSKDKSRRTADIFIIFGVRISEFPLGNRALNVELSIAAYEAALQVYTRDAFPQQWAMTQNNLGSAYQNRIRGDRADNLERAIAAYEAALQVRTRDAFPQDWAITQGNLVSHLLDRYKLTGKADDLDKAISGLQQAQAIASPGTDAYTNISYTLGTALDYRYSLHHTPADLAQASAAYRRAADTTPWASRQTDYYEKAADSLYQLGVALTQDGQWYEGLTALEASHAAYRDAHSRLGRADALQQMGRTHYLMSNFDKAGIYFRDALRIYKAEASLPGQAACHAGLGRLMLRLNFIDDAIAELHQACQLYTQLNDDARLGEIQQVYDLAQKVKAKQPLAAIPSPLPP